MCGLQFFVQIAVRGIRIHESVVCKRRAEAETDDETVQLRDRIQLTLCVKIFFQASHADHRAKRFLFPASDL